MRRTDLADDVLVTGLGLVTAAGIGTRATWNGLLRARPTAATDPLLEGLPVDFSCRVPAFDGRHLLGRRLDLRLDRACKFALVAAREATADAGLDPADWDPRRVAVVLGVGTCSFDTYEAEFAALAAGNPTRLSPLAILRSVPNMIPAEVALDLGARGPCLSVSTACASGTSALGVARDLLRAGRCDIAVTGGAESTCARVPAACFHQMQALSRRRDDPVTASRPFDSDRDGFVLGEGAGILVLERGAHARARGARARARFAGYGASCDAYHPAVPHPDGRGAADAIRMALDDAGLTPSDIGHVNAHGTSTRHNDLAESRALHRTLLDQLPVTSLKGTLGHAIGAAGGIEAACTVLSLEHQLIPPTANLHRLDTGIGLDVVHTAPRPTALTAAISNSFGFGGQNAVALFTIT
ncbi:beta-ketoacyl-[acyl-carrier-protein] synthase family protein [Streptomyces syringium]|uniref:beta-ketoacyl-[acyl-carrier-protein] synthase family protein n=1 Tax=Streptomyces syringium TaxID=76729 RepID=UPI0036E937D7